MISRVKGTHDVLDTTLLNYVQQQFRSYLTIYSFHEIIMPLLEPTELFVRSLGSQTDVVSKEMFIIQTTGDESICLRPEATASTMRAYLENNIQQQPWCVYTIGPMFRHERPQKGRFRQFSQLSIEVIGAASIAYDVQLITMLDRMFHELFKLDCYALLINFLGCGEDRKKFKEKLYDFLSALTNQLCQDCLVRKEKNIMRIFDCKQATCQALYQTAPHIAQFLCEPCQQEWQQVQDQLQILSVSYSYCPTLVRGLDYYDKTAFEFVSDNLGAQRAFCGGGRYNHLATQLGAPEDIPAVGAALGIERLLLLLEPIKDQLSLPHAPALQVVIPMSPEQHAIALLLADTLRAQNICVDILFDGESLKSMLRKASKLGAQYVLIIGSQEQAERAVTIKNMVTGTQEVIKQIDAAAYIKK